MYDDIILVGPTTTTKVTRLIQIRLVQEKTRLVRFTRAKIFLYFQVPVSQTPTGRQDRAIRAYYVPAIFFDLN